MALNLCKQNRVARLRRGIFCLLMLFSLNNIFAQNENIDTPNLSFEKGNLQNWQQYVGGFYLDPQDDSYHYDEWKEVRNTNQIAIVNGFKGSQDPVISCWDFPTNPDGITPVRIGSFEKAEQISGSSGNRKAAMAEKLVYKFKVTENTTLLTYRFAAVLHCPDLVNKGVVRAEHIGEQLPSFNLSVDFFDPNSQLETVLPCGAFTVSADSKNSYSLELVNDQPNKVCKGSAAAGNITEFAYRPWTYGTLNLSQHIGEEATITITVHDCLREYNGAVGPGSHRAYGYFWAETKKLELQVKNCGLDTAQIIAPEGFGAYEWTRSDNLGVETMKDKPSVALIPPELIKAGVTYSCKLTDVSGCTSVTLDTKLDEVGVNIDFVTRDTCDGRVFFTNKSSIDGDEIVGYSWDFGDGTYSSLENPDAKYMDPGVHNVALTVKTKMGCQKTDTKKINVRYFPHLKISAADSVCYGTEVELTALEASKDSKFHWSTGETTQTIRHKMTTSQNFELTVEDEYFCTYKENYWIVVKQNAEFLIQGDRRVCLNDTVKLTARAYAAEDNISFLWNTGDKTAEMRARPLVDSTEYWVTGFYKNGCSQTKNVWVHVNPLPVVSVANVAPICQGDVATLNADVVSSNGPVTYVWTDLYSGKERNVRPDTTTVYSVLCIDSLSCQSLPQSVTVVVRKNLEMKITGDSSVCEGKSAKLSVTGAGSNVEWYDGTQGVTTITRTPTQDTTYWVEGYAGICKVRAEFFVKIKDSPNVWIDASSSVLCKGDTAILWARGADSYTWNASASANADSIFVYPYSMSEYKVFGKNEKSGCVATASIVVDVVQAPTIRVKGDTKACYESVVRIEAFDPNDAATSFSWSNGSIGSVITPTILDNTTYEVVGENKYGCKATATHEVTLVDPPTISFDGKTTVCYGEPTTLKGLGALMYVWYDGEKESTGASFTFRPEANMTVRLTGSDVGNCPSSIEIPIVVMSAPSLFISGDEAVCLGDTFSIYASGATSYRWNTGDTTSSISYATSSTAEYTVYGTNEQGCQSSARHIVMARPAPLISIAKGEQTGCLNLPDTIRLTASGASLYKWSSEPYNASVSRNGFTSDLVATIDELTLLKVEGIDEFGCVGYAECEVDLLPRQEIDFSVNPSFIEEGSSNVRFVGFTPKEAVWTWDPGDGSVDERGVTASHNYDPAKADSFEVRVVAVDKFGCEYHGRSAVYTWMDFWGPEGFTPNGDGLNDKFHFLGGEYMDDFHFIIYNRMGEIVFTGNSINDEWDGKVDGEDAPWGVYGWVVNYNSHYMGINKSGDRKGFVTLIR